MAPLGERTAEALRARIRLEQAERRLPSIVAAVVRDGDVTFAAGGRVHGRLPTDDTQYRIGSITKTFTAVAIMRLRDEGLVELTDPVAAHVPDAPPGVTIAELLSHASGLQAETDLAWWERTPGPGWAGLAPTIAGASPPHPRGERFHYSNLGFGVLGQLVAARRGTSWSDALRREILDPLGLSRTTTRPAAPAAPGLAVHPYADAVLAQPEHDAGALAPAGQLWSTATDLARWAAFLAGDTGDVLAPETLAEMRRPRVLHDQPGRPWTAAVGLGLQVWNDDGRRSVGHGGSMPGFLAVVSVDVETGTGVVVAANTTAGLAPTIVTDLHALVRDHEPATAPAPWEPTAVPARLLDLTGAWYWGPRPYVLRLTGVDELTLEPTAGPGRASRFVPDPGPDVWVGLDDYYAGERLRVVRDGRGRPSHLDLASFVFTRVPYAPAEAIPGGVDAAGWGGEPGAGAVPSGPTD